MRARIEALAARHWWRPHPSGLARCLTPLSAIYGRLLRRHLARPPEALPVPVIVVGNLVVGGAGKTPTVIALVQALQRAGWHPGVISRGHGGQAGTPRPVEAQGSPAVLGDEPVLMRRRLGVPLWVGRARAEVARALCKAHPDVDVLVSDDGLQHRALPRQFEVVVFDERGAGNGLLLPAGPLREPLPPHPVPSRAVLYTAGRASTPLPGALAARRLADAVPLADWHAGRPGTALPLSRLPRPAQGDWLALAGIAAPEKFFRMLEAEGLRVARCPQPDHAPYATLPWPPGTTDVITTEKDAVKLSPQQVGTVRVWVVPLDLRLPDAFVAEVVSHLPARRPHPPSRPPTDAP